MLLLLALAANAHESEPQHIVLEDLADFYTGAELDSGWLPSGSPLQVRFAVEADGGAYVRMEGDSELTWPDALTLAFQGEAQTGEILQNATLSAVTYVKFDVDVYSWEGEIDRRGIDIENEAVFDPFVLGGSDPGVVELDYSGAVDQLIEYTYDVFTGVSVVFAADMHPEASSTFRGVEWQVEEDASITEEGGTAAVVPRGEPSQLVLSTFVAEYSNSMALVFTPSLSVCVSFVGCWELVAFDIPLSLADETFQQAFPVTDLEFPLPIIDSELTEYDFGQLEVGQLANLQVPVGNVGDLYLEAFTGLLGSDYFTIYPEYVYAGPGNEDGLVVTFAPESEGPFAATLVLESNDPLDPVHEIHLTGEGMLPEEPAEDSPENAVIHTEVKGCGCTSGGRASGGLALLLLGAVAVTFRRRRDPR